MDELTERLMHYFGVDRETVQRMIDDPAVAEKYFGPRLKHLNEMYREIVAAGGEHLVSRDEIERANEFHRELTRAPEEN